MMQEPIVYFQLWTVVCPICREQHLSEQKRWRAYYNYLHPVLEGEPTPECDECGTTMKVDQQLTKHEREIDKRLEEIFNPKNEYTREEISEKMNSVFSEDEDKAVRT